VKESVEMWYLLKMLFLGHVHNFEVLKRESLINQRTGSVGIRYVLKCKKCGHVKKVDLI